MYIMNRRPHTRRRRRAGVLALLLLAGAGAAGAAAWRYMEPQTDIGPPPPPKVTKVLAANEETRTVTAGRLSLSLPRDWEAFTAPVVPSHAYAWRNTAGTKGVRYITLYTSNLPRDLAVNRVLAVEPAGERVTLLGGVSDNCIGFAGAGGADGVQPGSDPDGRAPARWQGVQFSCDTGNYVRNVVGISSTAGPNLVRLESDAGQMNLFMTYTDSDVNPKFHIFTAAVESLRLR